VSEDITVLLRRIRDGDRAAEAILLPLVYEELRERARRLVRRERADLTLQPTALVHEAYLRLLNQEVDWQSRAHFYAVASHLMRQVLVDHARSHRAKKRGGSRQRVEWDERLLLSEPRMEDIIAIDEALTRLSAWDKRQCQVVEMRFFAGMNEEEISAVLRISVRTVKRDWTMARAWLRGQLRSKRSAAG